MHLKQEYLNPSKKKNKKKKHKQQIKSKFDYEIEPSTVKC